MGYQRLLDGLCHPARRSRCVAEGLLGGHRLDERQIAAQSQDVLGAAGLGERGGAVGEFGGAVGLLAGGRGECRLHARQQRGDRVLTVGRRGTAGYGRARGRGRGGRRSRRIAERAFIAEQPGGAVLRVEVRPAKHADRRAGRSPAVGHAHRARGKLPRGIGPIGAWQVDDVRGGAQLLRVARRDRVAGQAAGQGDLDERLAAEPRELHDVLLRERVGGRQRSGGGLPRDLDVGRRAHVRDLHAHEGRPPAAADRRGLDAREAQRAQHDLVGLGGGERVALVRRLRRTRAQRERSGREREQQREDGRPAWRVRVAGARHFSAALRARRGRVAAGAFSAP